MKTFRNYKLIIFKEMKNRNIKILKKTVKSRALRKYYINDIEVEVATVHDEVDDIIKMFDFEIDSLNYEVWLDSMLQGYYKHQNDTFPNCINNLREIAKIMIENGVIAWELDTPGLIYRKKYYVQMKDGRYEKVLHSEAISRICRIMTEKKLLTPFSATNILSMIMTECKKNPERTLEIIEEAKKSMKERKRKKQEKIDEEIKRIISKEKNIKKERAKIILNNNKIKDFSHLEEGKKYQLRDNKKRRILMYDHMDEHTLYFKSEKGLKYTYPRHRNLTRIQKIQGEQYNG